MKYIVIILLLSTSGVERIELKTGEPNCGEIAKAWTDVNMKYYDERNGNPKLQGYYNSKGKLLLGWICN